MLPYFEWSVPTKVVFGKGTIHKIDKNLKGLGQKCFLVTGRSSAEKHGYLQIVSRQLQEMGVEYLHFNKISPNPKTTEIDEAAGLIRQGKYDHVLALGGGSVMDAAKVIAMLAKNKGQAWDYIYKGSGSKYKKFNTALPIVMLPTLAATGSELNSGGVVSNPETKEKACIFGDALYPRLTIIDPELTKSVPYASTVDGAVDVICHVLEMYLSSDKDDYLQDQLSLAITKTIKRVLDSLKQDLEDSEARAQMFWASSLALSGIATRGRSGDWPMHDIEHVLSGRCDRLAHGRGLATILLKIMEFNKAAVAQKIIELSKYVFDADAADADQAIELWKKWLKAHGTGGSLKEYIGRDDINSMAEQIIRFSGTPDFVPNIKRFKKEDLMIFLKGLL